MTGLVSLDLENNPHFSLILKKLHMGIASVSLVLTFHALATQPFFISATFAHLWGVKTSSPSTNCIINAIHIGSRVFIQEGSWKVIKKNVINF